MGKRAVTKAAKKQTKHVRHGRFGGRNDQFDSFEPNANVVPFNRNGSQRGDAGHAPSYAPQARVECLNEAQGQYYLMLKSKPVIFGLGPAGTGKTHLAVGLACEKLLAKEIETIIVTRPMVGVSKTMGYLKGSMEEKFAPYFGPVRAIMERFLGRSHVENLISLGKIQIMPLEFIRGTTFDRAVMIMDEAQNCTIEEMQAFLTRKGRWTTVAVNGDLEQSDLKGQVSGLADAIKLFESSPNFGRFEFTEEDIVRDDIVKEVILAYRNRYKKQNA